MSSWSEEGHCLERERTVAGRFGSVTTQVVAGASGGHPERVAHRQKTANSFADSELI